MNKVQHDKNMEIVASVNKPDVKFYNIDEEPIRIYGIWREGDRYRRLPKDIADGISIGISDMCGTCAGGRVRFTTDSPYVAIKVEYGQYELSSTITHLAMAGFDMYDGTKYVGAFRPPVDFCGADFASVVDFCDAKERLITINMPLYSEVKSLYIGISKNSKISHAPDYALEKPIVFYGSSITNGAGASRPGAAYEARISRKLDFNYRNLGFGGLAKGERAMAEYISTLDMSAFVLDYDHNAKTPEYLEQTHEPFFKLIRESHPVLPIIIISRPNFCTEMAERFEIIKKTYLNAVANGDKNVYLIDGSEFFGDGNLDFTVDGTHPSDLGYYFMAERIANVLKSLQF